MYPVVVIFCVKIALSKSTWRKLSFYVLLLSVTRYAAATSRRVWRHRASVYCVIASLSGGACDEVCKRVRCWVVEYVVSLTWLLWYAPWGSGWTSNTRAVHDPWFLESFHVKFQKLMYVCWTTCYCCTWFLYFRMFFSTICEELSSHICGDITAECRLFRFETRSSSAAALQFFLVSPRTSLALVCFLCSVKTKSSDKPGKTITCLMSAGDSTPGAARQPSIVIALLAVMQSSCWMFECFSL